MRKSIFILFLLIGFISTSSFAQNSNFNGYIKEFSSKEYIPNAHIRINNKIIVTDSKGYFSGNLIKGDNEIRVSFIGFKTIDTVINYKSQSITKTFYLQESSNLLDAIVVSDSKNGHRYKESTVSMDIIEAKTFITKSPDNIIRAVDQLPSVHTIGDQINIRGGSGWTYGAGSRVLLLQDGVPMMEASKSEIQWYTIEPAATDQLEVLKGSSSVLYGASALNGTINIQTRRPKATPYTHISISNGFYDDPKRESLKWNTSRLPLNSQNLTAYHDQKIGNLEVSASANYFREQHYIKNNIDNKRVRLYSNIAHDLSEKNGLRYGVATSYIDNVVGESFIYHADSLAFMSFDDVTYDFHTRETSIRPYIHYQKPNSKWSHHLNGQYFKVFYIDTVNNFSTNYYGNYYSQYKNKNITFTTGLSSTFTNAESEAYGVEADQLNAGAFAQIEARYKRLSGVFGARTEFNTGLDTNYVVPVFRLGLNYEINENLNAKASFGQAVRFPSLFEYFFERNAGELSFFANPDLQPEKGNSYEIGLVGDFSLGNWRFQAEADGFLMRFDNMTELSFGLWGGDTDVRLNPLGIGFKEINVGKTEVSGIELNTKGYGKIGELELDFQVGYTYMNPIAIDKEYVYGSYANRAEDFAKEFGLGSDAGNLEQITNLLIGLGGNVNYANTSTNPNYLKYRFKHLFKADIGLKYKKWHPSINVRYNSFMENVDILFESHIFNKSVEDRYSDLELILDVLGVKDDDGNPLDLNQIDMQIVNARERAKKGTWLADFRLGYELNKNINFLFGVENVFNKDFTTRPGRAGAPRRFVFQTDIKF